MSDRYTELPKPDFIYQQVGDVEIDMEVFDHDDSVSLRGQNVPGGKFGFEIALSYSYIGYDCVQNICLDRDGAEALRDALDEALDQ